MSPGTGTASLRLRSGPNVTYTPELANMPSGTEVPVYATRGDWALVLYNSPDGPIYGWCSSEYLIYSASNVG